MTIFKGGFKPPLISRKFKLLSEIKTAEEKPAIEAYLNTLIERDF